MSHDLPPADECVDPVLGDQLWRLAESATASGLRDRLDAHLSVCAACRLALAHERAVAEGLGDGILGLGISSAVRFRRLLPLGGMAVAAAALILIFIMPLRTFDTIERADGGASRLLAPLPGEVVRDRSPELRWTPVEGARSYDVEIRDVDGVVAWSTRTEDHSAAPRGTQLVVGRDYRVRIEIVPAFAGEPLRGVFRVGSTAEFVKYRSRAADDLTWALFGLGLAMLAGGVVLSRRSGV